MAFIEVDPVAQDIYVRSEYREKDLVKQVPGTRWDSDNRLWRANLSWSTCLAFRGVFGNDLEIGPELTRWAWEHKQKVERSVALRGQLEEAALMAAEPRLYPFQRAGVAFLENAQQALIADEMGSGKTVQLIRTIARQEAEGSLPVLVVCPNSMKYTWKREFEVWAPNLNVVVIDGGAATRRKQIAQIADGEAEVAVINWESLRLHTRIAGYGNIRLRRCVKCGGVDEKVKESSCESHVKELNGIPWGTVVADEAHRAKEPKAKQTRALWAVSRDAKFRYAATGTPIANHPGELWSIMNFVSPQEFPRKTAFVDRYCLQSWNAFGGMEIVGIRPEMKDEFSRIVDPLMIRRLKSVVLPQLPPKTYVTRTVEMTNKQAKAYKEMVDNMITELENGDLVYATNPLTKLTRLSQFACAYAELDENDDVHLSEPSCKVDALMELLDEAEGEQVVVFAESRQLIELASARLEKEGIQHGLITGAIDPHQRQMYVDSFQGGHLPVMLATLGAGGEGITLTAARIAVFLQRSWSLVKNKQAEDRIHRPGQDADKVEIVDIIARDTVEENRFLALEGKEERLQEVVRDKDIIRMLLKGAA